VPAEGDPEPRGVAGMPGAHSGATSMRPRTEAGRHLRPATNALSPPPGVRIDASGPWPVGRPRRVVVTIMGE